MVLKISPARPPRITPSPAWRKNGTFPVVRCARSTASPKPRGRGWTMKWNRSRRNVAWNRRVSAIRSGWWRCRSIRSGSMVKYWRTNPRSRGRITSPISRTPDWASASTTRWATGLRVGPPEGPSPKSGRNSLRSPRVQGSIRDPSPARVTIARTRSLRSRTGRGGGPPLGPGKDLGALRREPTAEPGEVPEDLPDHLAELPAASVAERRQVVVLGPVEVLLGLDPGIGGMLDRGGAPEFPGDPGDRLGELVDRVGGIELVEDPVLARLRGVLEREEKRLHRVFEGDEAPGLAALPVRGDREAEDRLDDEPVEGGAPGFVEVEPGQQRVAGDLGGPDPVDDPLHHVGRPEVPDPGRVHHVARIEDLAPVVPRPRVAGERQGVAATPILDLEEPFGDLDVGGSVLPHRAHLHEMGLRAAVPDRVEEVEGPGEVLDLRRHRVVDVDHRVGGAPLLGQVDDRIGAFPREHLVDEPVVAKVAPVEGHRPAERRPDRFEPPGERRDRRRRPAADLPDPAARHEVVDADDLVALGQEPEREGPARVAVDPGDQDLHAPGAGRPPGLKNCEAPSPACGLKRKAG